MRTLIRVLDRQAATIEEYGVYTMLPSQQLAPITPWPPDNMLERMDELAHKGKGNGDEVAYSNTPVAIRAESVLSADSETQPYTRVQLVDSVNLKPLSRYRYEFGITSGHEGTPIARLRLT
ncbi:hypothetical protein EVAR_36294_1 [Eumeta japonica]|uniref:Uncharacterized protein n=1 Tax=Eumeta variegata TaxID=151549 RepID=A0A4C1VIX0_EUMVA|nr:hypothetical protein EVAR_36294_1 [Eumeta japonica]